MKTVLRTHDFDAFARLDAEFNRLCIAACRNEFAGSMMQVIAPLKSPVLVYRITAGHCRRKAWKPISRSR